jgi:acetyl esterase/lipase
MTSDREAEGLAVKIMAMGFHAAILRYSCAPSIYPTALTELAMVISLLRKNADQWHIDPDKIVIQGSSAGGHLAASFGVFWKEAFLAEAVHTASEQLKPNGLLLSYPVITSGQFAHRESFRNLLGDHYNELIEKMSLENQVSSDTPKTFLWHTFPDDCVPVENALLFVMALREKNIPTEFHLFPVGGHGLGLATQETACPNGYGIQEECQSWISLAETWLKHL